MEIFNENQLKSPGTDFRDFVVLIFSIGYYCARPELGP
jgi:hypothetical protein